MLLCTYVNVLFNVNVTYVNNNIYICNVNYLMSIQGDRGCLIRKCLAIYLCFAHKGY